MQEEQYSFKRHFKLTSRSRFITLVNNTERLLDSLSYKIHSQSMNVDVVIQQLNASISKSFDEQNQVVKTIYGIIINDQLKEYDIHFANNWNKLTKKYGPQLTYDTIQKECIEYFKIKYKSLYNNSMPVSANNTLSRSSFMADESGIGPCSWKYTLCIAGATAAAIVCHAGCETTALATTAGLGIPVCVALCATIQAAASVQCWDSYCQPVKTE